MGLCRRVSYETLHEHGSEVAYQVRPTPDTHIAHVLYHARLPRAVFDIHVDT